MAQLPTIDEALARVLAAVQPLPLEDVALEDALGRVLAVDAPSPVDLPPFDSSAMDGHAVRAADTPGVLRVVGQSAAGRPAESELAAGEAIAISTGGVVPTGADAVVPIELSEEHDGGLRVPATAVGVNVRPRGGDVVAGAAVVTRGTRLGPAQLGALAACGIASVRCGRRPRVAVLPTGTELRRPGDELGPGEIYESNSVLLASQLRTAGAEPVVFDPVPDNRDATREALARALELDVVVTSGGVSVGPHDLVREALSELGATEVFWRVAVKPGKPIAFSTRDATLAFGLPGNPVSSLVGFELFVRPALLALQSASSPRPLFECGTLGSRLLRGPDRDELVRSVVEDGGDGAVLMPVSGQESHMIARAAGANALVLVERGDGEVAAGSRVSFLRV